MLSLLRSLKSGLKTRVANRARFWARDFQKLGLQGKIVKTTRTFLFIFALMSVSAICFQVVSTFTIGSMHDASKKTLLSNAMNVAKSDLVANVWAAFSQYKKGKPVEDFYLGEIRLSQAAFEEPFAFLKEEGVDSGEESFVDDIGKQWKEVLGDVDAMVGRFKEGTAEETAILAYMGDLSGKLKELGNKIQALQIEFRESAHNKSIFARFLTGLVFLVGFALFAAAYAVSRFVRGLLSKTAEEVEQIGAELEKTSSEVNGTADQLQTMGQSLSSGSQTQASACQQTAAAVEEMRATLNQTAHNVKNVLDRAQETQAVSTQGMDAVARFRTALDEIRSANADLKTISGTIREIEQKTKIINDIVFQTKLLSFNASVESARAGEHGRGFAVVAQEIGTLAQVSGTAAKEINHLIQTGIARITESIETTGRKIAGVGDQSKACLDAFEQISGSVNSLTAVIQDISNAASQQKDGVDQVSEAVQTLDRFTQQNHQLASESASVSTSLTDHSESLGRNVLSLKAIVFGGEMETPETTETPAGAEASESEQNAA